MWLAVGVQRARTTDVNAAIAEFRDTYAVAPSDLRSQIEVAAIGASWGANGYTTVNQADEMGRLLELGPGRTLLDVGTGRGWPGLYLAVSTGCSLVGTDLPLEALQVATRRARAEGVDDRVGFVVAGAAAQPFARSSFDAIVHSDVLC
jgi:SAM-dependent methyltransferase